MTLRTWFRPASTRSIGLWAVYLTALMGGTLALVLALELWHERGEYRLARQREQINQANQTLYSALDGYATVRGRTRLLLASDRRAPADIRFMQETRQKADETLRHALALTEAADPGSAALVDELSRLQGRLQPLNDDVDRLLADPRAAPNTNLALAHTLSVNHLLDTGENLVAHGNRLLAHSAAGSIGRIGDVQLTVWRFRNDLGQKAIGLAEMGVRQRPPNDIELAALVTANERASISWELLARDADTSAVPELARAVRELGDAYAAFERASPPFAAAGAGARVAFPAPAPLLERLAATTRAARRLNLEAAQLSRRTLEAEVAAARSGARLDALLLTACVAITLFTVVGLRRRVLDPLRRLQLILDSASDAILTLDERLDVLMANPGAERLFGLVLPALLGQPLGRVLELTAAERARLSELPHTLSSLKFDARLTADAGGRYVSVTASPILAGKSMGVLIILSDIHERVLAERSLSRSLTVLGAIGQVQNRIFAHGRRSKVYRDVLMVLTEVAACDYAFVATATVLPDGSPALQLNDAVARSGAAALPESYEWQPGRLLPAQGAWFDQVLAEGRPVLFDSGSATASLPPGVPPALNFLALPVMVNGNVVGVLGLAGRTGGFDAALIAEFEPLLGSWANIVAFFKEEDARRASETYLHQVLREEAAIFLASPVGLLIVQEETVRRANPHAATMFAASADELLGLRLTELLADPADWPTLAEQLAGSCREGEGDAAEFHCRRQDGETFWGLLKARPLDAEQPELGFVLVCLDMSEQKRHEAMLEQAKEDADAASRAKSAFLATMSHEIRTPMNGVIGMLELLSLSALDAEQRDALATVDASARSLLRLIDDILDFSKIEAGRLEIVPEPMSVSALVKRVQALHGEVASQKGLWLTSRIDPGIAPALLGDAFRLGQVLNNFVSNAIKFTPTGRVDIAARCVARDEAGQTIRLSVTDTGIGMDEASLARVFDPFTQADSKTTRRFGGTGLGLTICRRLAELMGARLDVTSAPGRGTEIDLTLTLPYADEAALAPAAASAPTPRRHFAGHAPVLLAEDNPTNRKLLAKQLELLGLAVDAAEDGEMALALWSEGRYSLVLTDCHMPRVDGYQLARAIRAAETPGRRIPIVACTANTSGEEALTCQAAGMDEVLTKPLTLDKLAAALARWLQAAEPDLPSAPEPVPQAEGVSFDRAALAVYSGGDPEVEAGILREFWDTNQADLSGLAEALAGGDLPAVVRFSHRVKGASRMVGAQGLGDAAEAVEHAARGGACPAPLSEALWAERDRLAAVLAEAGLLQPA